MLDFKKLSEDCYIVYKNGRRVTQYPLTREELLETIEKIAISDEEALLIERFYGRKGDAI